MNFIKFSKIRILHNKVLYFEHFGFISSFKNYLKNYLKINFKIMNKKNYECNIYIFKL